MIPDREAALRILAEAESCNPGAWVGHCRNAAVCAEKVAAAVGLHPEKAYVLVLLHDVGRKFGQGHMMHVYYGWKYMNELGYDEVAKICLTHSFTHQDFDCFIGRWDIPVEAQQELRAALEAAVYDDYDRLAQLCDGLALSTGLVRLEDRMADVRRRYGMYPQEKWDANMALLEEFSRRAGRSIYDIVK